jgi:hypothetical protein
MKKVGGGPLEALIRSRFLNILRCAIHSTGGVRMPNDLSTKCEQKKQFQVGEGREWRWVEVAVSKAFGSTPETIRCLYCHGAVRIHKQQAPDGPQDHVEHRSKQDSENCRAGIYFKGSHKLSSQPVL